MTLAPHKLLAAPLSPHPRLTHVTLFCTCHCWFTQKWMTSHSLTWLKRRGDKAVLALVSVSEEKGMGGQVRGSVWFRGTRVE